MSERTVREALQTIGLSEKEIEAYITVLKQESATMGTVAEAGNISQSYVYEIANRLADRDLLTIDESETPTVLRARPPGETADALTTRIESFEEAASSIYDRTATGKAGFEVINVPRTVRRRVTDHIETAETELLLVVPAQSLSRILDLLEAAQRRDVMVYCLLFGTEKAIEETLASLDRPAEYFDVLRGWSGYPSLLVLRDGVAGLFGTHNALANPDDSHAFAFTQHAVGGMLSSHVISNVWPLGEEKMIAEPLDLPRSFTNFRTAVTTATLYLQSDTPLVADLSVIDLETRAETTFESAPVRSVKQALIEPTEYDIPIECALVIETDDGLATVGGNISPERPTEMGPYFDDYGATDVTLRFAD
ncbi:TrmB family transcriptional regulator [Halovenus marina]|uniref:TrmB family transcriptional regulator n=1 Tax=Halovenus marina TaxID=3396621 RepID=UPI003F566EF9